MRNEVKMLKCSFFLLFFLFFVQILLNTGCTNEKTESKLEEIWPLKEGNWWKYGTKGSEYEEVTIEVIEKKENKENKENKNNAEVYVVEFDFGTYQVYEYYYYDEEGLIWFQMDNPLGSYKRQPPEYLFKTPSQENLQWKWEGEIQTISGSSFNYQGEGKTSQLSTIELELPHGSYKAIKIERELNLTMAGEDLDVTDRRYYVPELGLVKQEVKENGYEQLYMIIDDYEVDY